MLRGGRRKVRGMRSPSERGGPRRGSLTPVLDLPEIMHQSDPPRCDLPPVAQDRRAEPLGGEREKTVEGKNRDAWLVNYEEKQSACDGTGDKSALHLLRGDATLGEIRRPLRDRER